MDKHQEHLNKTPKWHPERPPQDKPVKIKNNDNWFVKLYNGIKRELKSVIHELG